MRRHYPQFARKDLPPSLRLPDADMSRLAFLRLVTGWSGAVAAMLAIAVVARLVS